MLVISYLHRHFECAKVCPYCWCPTKRFSDAKFKAAAQLSPVWKVSSTKFSARTQPDYLPERKWLRRLSVSGCQAENFQNTWNIFTNQIIILKKPLYWNSIQGTKLPYPLLIPNGTMRTTGLDWWKYRFTDVSCTYDPRHSSVPWSAVYPSSLKLDLAQIFE